MSTHGCFAPSFPLFSSSSRLPQPDIGAQDPYATIDDDYYSGGAYYYVQAADDNEE